MHLLYLLQVVGVRAIHHVQQQVSISRFLQRGRKRINQPVRQIPDKTDRVRQRSRARALPQVELPRRGTDAEKGQLQKYGRIEQLSDYGAPMVTTRGFWDSGKANRQLTAEISIDCPVRLLHGQNDADVPHDISLQLAARLRSADVQVILVKDGDHRLSRPQDIALLIATVDQLLETL